MKAKQSKAKQSKAKQSMRPGPSLSLTASAVMM
jgi:hypothetical protein